MSISFYTLSVESFRQIVGGVINILDKASQYAIENDVNPDSFLELRTIDDMLPLTFQLNSVRHHSLGALRGVINGVFEPPPTLPAMNFSDYQQLMADTLSELEKFAVDDIDALESKSLIFRVQGREFPFTADKFVRSFSLPNVNFHATTAYNLLRREGVPLGKMTYLGALQTNP